MEGSARGAIRGTIPACLDGLGKTIEKFSRDSLTPGRDLNPRPPE
jgi:hypothetical protein